MSEKTIFRVGQIVVAINIDPLEGNDKAPPLILGDQYQIIAITYDSKGNQHLDVGLVSKLSYVRSIETGEELPHGDKFHWCHPSRFEVRK